MLVTSSKEIGFAGRSIYSDCIGYKFVLKDLFSTGTVGFEPTTDRLEGGKQKQK